MHFNYIINKLLTTLLFIVCYGSESSILGWPAYPYKGVQSPIKTKNLPVLKKNLLLHVLVT